MKKTTISPAETEQSNLRFSLPERVTVEKRFTLPLSRPVTLRKSES